MADWFYGKDNAQHGPVLDSEIRDLLSSGQITPQTIVWREGMPDWIPLANVPDFQGTVQPPYAAAQPPASPYSPPQTHPGQPPYSTVAPTDGLSIASLVCGILAVLSCYFGGLFGLPAVICGHMSLKKINTSPTLIQGKGMAIAGLVTGYIGILMSLCVVAIFIFAIASGTATPSHGP